MGYILHHAIIVTDWDETRIPKAWAIAAELFTSDKPTATGHGLCLLSPIIRSPINGYQHFFIAPDGSKEGWAESDFFEAKRDEFLARLRALDPDGVPAWVEVAYGSDDHCGTVSRHAWQRQDQPKG